MTKSYSDVFYHSRDGLRLYARDYGGTSDQETILCLHGLTRNSSDFHHLALHLKNDFRVISVDQRGRGLSEYDTDKRRYRADIYCEDMVDLLAHLNVSSVIVIGTSMGGIMTMMMAAQHPNLFKAAVLNDIGPELDPAGLARIAGYVGTSSRFESWDAAAEALKAQGPDVFPTYTDEDWVAFAVRTCEEKPDGSIGFAYDPALANAFKNDDTAAAPVDMWPLYEALQPIPLLIIRGEISDLLSPITFYKMKRTHPNCDGVNIPEVGHAPMLFEPQSLAAIDSFLEPYR